MFLILKELAMKNLIFIGLFIILSNISYSVEYWSQPLHGYGINSIAVKDSNIFVVTSQYSVFRTTDKGINWTSLKSNITYMHTHCILTKDNDIFIGAVGGVSKSTDNGESGKK